MSHIKPYCRIKPGDHSSVTSAVNGETLHIHVSENTTDRPRSSSSSSGRTFIDTVHSFRFKQIFKQNCSQNDVFEGVAKNIVQDFLAGYNGTIFAYGQTGTGKTYTIDGGTRSYEDRGLTSRALTMIFDSLKTRDTDGVNVRVSYMEIYQNVGYDLLNSALRHGPLNALFPEVYVVENPDKSFIIRNLLLYEAPTEEVAQSLLLAGQANRRVAETPVNQRSSRSHAVFTIYLTVKRPEDDVITSSKLHFVDLAGSERVSKTGVEGQQLTEAKSINLSLHHLERVIVALQEDGSTSMKGQIPGQKHALNNRWVESFSTSSGIDHHSDATPTPGRHIPYRDSLLTMVLRDSLENSMSAKVAIARQP